MAPLAQALQALRGVALVTAVTLLAEVGDLTRCADPMPIRRNDLSMAAGSDVILDSCCGHVPYRLESGHNLGRTSLG